MGITFYKNDEIGDRSSIVEVQTDAGRWSSIPDAIFNDPRLDCAARGIMGWFLSRPAGWQIRIEAMRRANGLTEHSWQKNVSKQLLEAGYLFVSKIHKEGKLVWVYKVFAVSQKPLIPRFQSIENTALIYTKLVNQTETAKLRAIERSRDKATKRDKALVEFKQAVKQELDAIKDQIAKSV